MSTDQIQKTIILQATPERVWKAVSDHTEFGAWFGVEMDGPFVPGQEAVGRIVPTQVDAEVARLQEPYRGTAFRIRVEQVDPMRLFSFRWHPFAVDQTQNYDAEPMTLVTFELATVDAGVRLTITETGFDQLPVGRREMALKANDGGWEHQTRLVDRYLALHDQTSRP